MTTTDQTRLQLKSSNSNSLIITINPEYSSLVYPLSDLEYEALKNSIKEDGLHYPLIVNPKGELLDGHHRYKISKELGILPIKYEIKYFKDSIEEKKFVIDINLRRRQLNDFQKAELAYKLEEIEKERARLRQLSTLKEVKDTLPIRPIERDSEKGDTCDIVSKKVGISRGTYERAKTIIKYGSEETKKKLIDGKSSIFKESEKIRKDQKREELISQMNSSESNCKKTIADNCKLILGDFREKGREIEDNSIDLIFTDPPYGKKYLPLYEELAKLAVRVLKLGGSLVFYLGHIILDQVIGVFNNFSLTDNNTNSINLKYWWTLAVKHSGHHTKIHPRYIFAEWKPMVWYIKGDRINDLVISNTIGDYIESVAPLKVEHEWQQSPIEAQYVIKNLTIEKQIVLDPMMGSGTTGIAALRLNRKSIGIEKDSETFGMARARIKNFCYLDNN